LRGLEGLGSGIEGFRKLRKVRKVQTIQSKLGKPQHNGLKSTGSTVARSNHPYSSHMLLESCDLRIGHVFASDYLHVQLIDLLYRGDKGKREKRV